MTKPGCWSVQDNCCTIRWYWLQGDLRDLNMKDRYTKMTTWSNTRDESTTPIEYKNHILLEDLERTTTATIRDEYVETEQICPSWHLYVVDDEETRSCINCCMLLPHLDYCIVNKRTTQDQNIPLQSMSQPRSCQSMHSLGCCINHWLVMNPQMLLYHEFYLLL
jgi:hypothetical protein